METLRRLRIGLLLLVMTGPVLGAVGDPAQALPLAGAGQWKVDDVSPAMQIFVLLTALSLIPSLLIAMTSFTRIIVVLSILRTALGLQQTPPNVVLISLSLFLTLFSMTPVLKAVDAKAVQPFVQGKITVEQFGRRAAGPLKEFMVRQTREEDLALMVDMSGDERPNSINDVRMLTLIPAFMLSELYTAFKIGFVIFLPFVLIDMVVASILMSMGMMMVPPMMISLPVKLLVFVLIDGWSLVVGSLLSSFT